jgi:hypothetical protein
MRPAPLLPSEQLFVDFVKHSEMNGGHSTSELFAYIDELERLQAIEEGQASHADAYPFLISPTVERRGFLARLLDL